MNINKFQPQPIKEEDVSNAGEFVVGVLMSGLSFEQIQQAVWDAYPEYEETTIAMTEIFRGFNRLQQLSEFWGKGDE